MSSTENNSSLASQSSAPSGSQSITEPIPVIPPIIDDEEMPWFDEELAAEIDAIDAASEATRQAERQAMLAEIAELRAQGIEMRAQIEAVVNAQYASRGEQFPYRIGHLEKFSGADTELVEDWLEATAMGLRASGILEGNRVRIAVTLLKGEAIKTVAKLDQFDPMTASWDDLCKALREAFGAQDRQTQARYDLDAVEQQGELSDYIRNFQMLVAQVGRDSFAQADLVHRFKQGLTGRLKDKCLHRGDGLPWDNLNDLITFSTNTWAAMTADKGKGKKHVDADPNPLPNAGGAFKKKVFQPKGTKLLKRKAGQAGSSSSQGGKRYQHDISAISKAEKQRRFNQKLCLRCGQSGHRVVDCKNAVNLADQH